MHGVVDIWIANAVLLAALMKHRREDWAWIAGAGFVANVAALLLAYRLDVALSFTFLNFLEIFLIAIPLRKLGLDHDFSRPKVLLAFYALAVLAPVFSALPFAAFVYLDRGAPFFETAMHWFCADALGLVIFVPPLLTVQWPAVKAMFRNEQIVWTTTLVGILVVAILFNFYARSYPFAFRFFPIILLMTFQRGFAGGALGLLLAGLYMIVPAVIGESSSFAKLSKPICKIFTSAGEISPRTENEVSPSKRSNFSFTLHLRRQLQIQMIQFGDDGREFAFAFKFGNLHVFVQRDAEQTHCR